MTWNISLEDQLRDIVNNDTYNLIARANDSYSDVVSGAFYKGLVQNRVISQNDITLQFNTDGVNLCKSSTMSLWPIQLCINELPYLVRKEKMILRGLWYGKDKPNMHVFLHHFVRELTELHDRFIVNNTLWHTEDYIYIITKAA